MNMLSEYKQDSLRDVIKKFRQNSSNTSGFISKTLADIKKELFSNDKNVKVHALQKLIFLYLNFHDIKWASFNTMEVLCTCGPNGKRYSYLIGQFQYKNNPDFLQLMPNQIRIDLKSQNLNYINSCLSFLNNVLTLQMASELTKDVEMLLNVNNNHLRKKLIITLTLAAEKYIKAGTGKFWDDLMIKLITVLGQKEISNGVSICIVSSIQRICKLSPGACVTVFVELMNYMTKCEINWNLIKIIDIFGMLFAYEPKFTKKKEFIKILADQLVKTKSKSVEAQLVKLVITSFDVKTNPAVGELIQNCEERLKKLLFNQDNNLLIISLRIVKELCLANKLTYSANYLPDVLKILDSNSNKNSNKNIQIECMEIINLTVSNDNFVKIVEYLFELIPKLGSKAILTILNICTCESYSRLEKKDDFLWFLNILFIIADSEFEKETELKIAYVIRDVAQRIETLRDVIVEKSYDLIQRLVKKSNEKLIAQEKMKKKISFAETNTGIFTEDVKYKHPDTLITVLCFIVGEYSMDDKIEFFKKALNDIPLVREYYFIPFVTTLIKLIMKNIFQGKDCVNHVAEFEKMVDYKSNFLDLEALECNVIMNVLANELFKNENDKLQAEQMQKICGSLFDFKLLPLHENAQSMVYPPKDLDLNLCFPINEEELQVSKSTATMKASSAVEAATAQPMQVQPNEAVNSISIEEKIVVDKNLYVPK